MSAAPRPLIALVGAHLPSYHAAEQDVFGRARSDLERLAADLDFELLAFEGAIVERAEAERIADACLEAEADLVLLLHGSFVMGDLVLPFADRGLRLGLWASEEPTRSGPILLNNFVSINLAAGVLRRYLRGAGPHKWFYGAAHHPWFAPRLATTLAALRGLRQLRGARLGLIGGLAPTFYNLAVDESALRASLGSEVGHHELDEVFSRVRDSDEAALARVVAELSDAAGGRVEVPAEELRLGAAIYLALRALAHENGYQALAVSDWPAFQEQLDSHPGMAFSWLDQHDGVPVAAEGDVLGAATMLLLRAVSGSPAMLLDMNTVDEEREALLMWHCGGSPLAFADETGVRWTHHSTLGRKGPREGTIGAVADLRFRRQPTTVARLLDSGSALFSLDARVIDSPHAGYDGSRGWLAGFAMDGGTLSLADLVNTVMSEGIDHHFILAAGHHDGALREFAVWAGLESVAPLPYRDHLQAPARRTKT